MHRNTTERFGRTGEDLLCLTHWPQRKCEFLSPFRAKYTGMSVELQGENPIEASARIENESWLSPEESSTSITETGSAIKRAVLNRTVVHRSDNT
jgi:hypothetical protein